MKAKDTLTKRELKIIDLADEIMHKDPIYAGELGFIHRFMALTTMPHKKTDDWFYRKTNGNYQLVMTSHPDHGLPYGIYPRLVLAWLSEEVAKRKTRVVYLGNSLSEWMRSLGLTPTGGRWGTIGALKNQLKRLFSCNISISQNDPRKGIYRRKGFMIATEIEMLWDPTNPSQAGLWDTKIKLSEEFYEELVKHPVPIDKRVLKLLGRSPLELDLYFFLTYRLYFLNKKNKPVFIKWEYLQNQFGSNYKHLYQFKPEFERALSRVKSFWPYLKFLVEKNGLTIFPCKALIEPKKTKKK